jgi:hypothetical protein
MAQRCGERIGSFGSNTFLLACGIFENAPESRFAVEPTAEIVLEEHALLKEYLGAMQARTSRVDMAVFQQISLRRSRNC